ncbi:glycosyltransferase family 4 protein [Candidatus Kaiserbacteria bacterium]|nr:glycosyltransferase family 4 protein [Candidatus Kaiserbacteria bacterium]
MGSKPQRLLVVTQVVDSTDPFLGFFHGWLEELAKHFEHIHVICLKEGEHKLPANVHVHSLGKEKGESRGKYVFRFLGYVWKLRGEYDTVFVHMNQEYILLAGWLWKLLGKRMYMWRNHYAGGFLTDMAAMFAVKVFCTSAHSYTAKYKKTVIMPVGVDTQLFAPGAGFRMPRSILFLSRFAPAKKPDVLLEALGILSKEGVQFTTSFYGTALPQDTAYREKVIKRAQTLGLGNFVNFYEGVPHTQAPDIFNKHEIFVNLSSSGTYDKTMFEAAASGCVVIAASKDFATVAGEQSLVAEDVKAVADKLREFLALADGARATLAAQLREKVLAGQSLPFLAQRVITEMSEKK